MVAFFSFFLIPFFVEMLLLVSVLAAACHLTAAVTPIPMVALQNAAEDGLMMPAVGLGLLSRRSVYVQQCLTLRTALSPGTFGYGAPGTNNGEVFESSIPSLMKFLMLILAFLFSFL
jgi:hypothetical protein